MRRTSDEETLQSKESYKRLEAILRSRVFPYREDNGIFIDPLFNEEVHTFGQNNKLLQGGLSPPKCNFWAQDQVIDPS